jgi:hypothetical protein
MSGPAYGNANRSVHAAVRDLAAAYLDREGIVATVKRTPAGLSDSLGDDAISPDLSVRGVHLDVTSRLTPYKLAEDLESARRAASINGTDVAAFIQWRSGLEIGDAYVVTSLRDFSKLLRAAEST